jgi:hypothetical protein
MNAEVTADASYGRAMRIIVLVASGDSGRVLTANEAQSVCAELWDLKGEVVTLRSQLQAAQQRNAALSVEVDAVVGQVVTEETRANRVQRQLTAACAILEGFLDVNHATHWRGRARDFLATGDKCQRGGA